ncbi:hypothetical protein COLO4_24949 [Corchorus olitorius]|uniref:Uncharacterized protein n=1 Tax=Corchorus olitorius TaxID=93759 RepID=A0A1R3I5R5_9ROSI|nr:hypothetical protein COLO4_24949 [Corchorus olitorius]
MKRVEFHNHHYPPKNPFGCKYVEWGKAIDNKASLSAFPCTLVSVTTTR